LFADAHISPIRIIMAFIAGTAYAVLYLKSQRLLISTLAHMTTNLLSLFLPGDLVSFWMVPVSVICLTACLLIVIRADPRKPGG
jgi:membrane protease YdiL (CAAX protease family)